MPATNGCKPAAPCGGHNSQAGAVAAAAGGAAVEVAAVVPAPVVPLVAEVRLARPAPLTKEVEPFDAPVVVVVVVALVVVPLVAASAAVVVVGELTAPGSVVEVVAAVPTAPVVAAVCAATGVATASKSGKARYVTSCQALPRRYLVGIMWLYGSRACGASRAPGQKSRQSGHPRSR